MEGTKRGPAWRWTILGVALAALAPAAAGGETIAAAPAAQATAPVFDAAQRKDLGRIEAYLNGLRTLRARFVQVTPEGGFAEGTLHLSRPGRVRVEYDPPEEILLVADGEALIYFDKGLEQVTYMPLASTPARFLLSERIALGEEVSVTALNRAPGLVQISLVDREEPEAGKLTITFGDPPFVLRNWTVEDVQGQSVTVALTNLETGLDLDPGLFEFVNPLFRKRFPTY